MSKEKKIITFLSLVICFLLVFIYCLSPLHAGINSGGLNAQVERSVGLSGINDGNFYIKYNITGIDDGIEVANNSYTSFIRAIVSLTDNFSDMFDIRIISVIYLIFLLISVFYLIKYIDLGSFKANIIFALITIFIYFDISYLLYLNTLYAEGAFYVFFILNISLYIKLVCSKKPQLPTTIIYFLLSAFICRLKPDLLFMAVPYAAMGIYLIFKRKGYTFRTLVLILTIILLVHPFMSSSFTDSLRDEYNSVFYGVLYENGNVKKTLGKLNIPEEYKTLAGTNTYEDLPEFVSEEKFKTAFYDNISHKKLMQYYILNPKDYLSQYKYVAYNAFETYPKYTGNFTGDSGMPVGSRAKGFMIYNLIKEKLFPKTLWFVNSVPLLLILLLIGYRKKINNNGIVVMGMSVSIFSIIIFNLPMINSGLVDISRTMAIFNVAFDTVTIMLISIFIYITTKRKQEFKDKYGLTQ